MDKNISLLHDYQKLINDKLAQVAAKNDPVSFYSPVKYILDSEGKRIRPILVMLACEAVGGNIDHCLDSAVAVELLHNFTLVHDDIMDQDDLRRGRQTVHRKWDEATAILAGDGLVALAYQYLLKTKSSQIQEICQIFTDGIIELCEGQALDKEFENQLEIELSQYLLMIEKKTARLLMISTEIGAIIGGATIEERHILKQFSKELGSAFQIQDDLLDIQETSGKTFGSDVQQKKKTILLIHALNYGTEQTRNRIFQILKKPQIETEDIAEVIDLFNSTGTLDFARNQVKSGIERAEQLLKNLRPSRANDVLQYLVEKILNRKY